MGMGIDREKLGCEISLKEESREGECGDGEMVNTNTNRLFRNQGSISYGHRSFKRLYIYYTTYYITDSGYYNRPTPTPRDDAFTS